MWDNTPRLGLLLSSTFEVFWHFCAWWWLLSWDGFLRGFPSRGIHLGMGNGRVLLRRAGLVSGVWDCPRGILVPDELLIWRDIHVLQGCFQALLAPEQKDRRIPIPSNKEAQSWFCHDPKWAVFDLWSSSNPKSPESAVDLLLFQLKSFLDYSWGQQRIFSCPHFIEW